MRASLGVVLAGLRSRGCIGRAQWVVVDTERPFHRPFMLSSIAHISTHSTVFVKASSFVNRDLAGMVAVVGELSSRKREKKETGDSRYQSIGKRFSVEWQTLRTMNTVRMESYVRRIERASCMLARSWIEQGVSAAVPCTFRGGCMQGPLCRKEDT